MTPEAERPGRGWEPRQRLTLEGLGLVLIFVLVLVALTFVFVLTRNTDDVEALAAGIETLSSLAAVLAGAMAGYLGRSALGNTPFRTAERPGPEPPPK